jgi:hypothetical protein
MQWWLYLYVCDYQTGADLAEREGIIAALLALPDVRSVKEFPAAANK